MECTKCRRDAVIFQRYSGLRLCRDHFVADVEAKAKREIRRQHWLATGDVIAVLLCGDLSSVALLGFLVKVFGKRPDISILALVPEDGNKTCRQVAVDLGVACHEVTGGRDPDGIVQGLGATKFAVGTALDDIALDVLATVLEGHADRLAGPRETGTSPLSRIAPFSVIPAEEVALYARLTLEHLPETPSPVVDDRRADIRALLDEYAAGHPATKFALKNLKDELAGICGEGERIR
ncbi:MAG: tRNA(Ile)-lysidine synthase [Methanofollis sp.]|uniref:tRNA(Ile)-lysidine synthase n=1 Tax=Methanofollis sp. TaxID=2052835 RepID=UPI002627528D|nr:tRNA(Ile)-lysidine synthase [Methanofollis sp.]MDD4256058.1 tRNA(Ile)-lysidine synthase [Methanofollis sp.]